LTGGEPLFAYETYKEGKAILLPVWAIKSNQQDIAGFYKAYF